MPTTIRIGAVPERATADALYLDGRRADPRPVTLGFDDAARRLTFGAEAWPYDELRTLPGQADTGKLVVTRQGDPLSRLVLEDSEAMRLVAARARRLRKRPRPQGLGRIAAWAVAAVASVALIIGVMIPFLADRLAGFLPPGGERALGEATLGQVQTALSQFGGEDVATCTGAEGNAALDALAETLTRDVTLPHEPNVRVLSSDLVNAFALPGGYVVLFDGLLDAAESPDEVAAVLAHEIGHVAARDPTRLALRSAGSIGILGLLFGDFAGGTVVLFLVERLIAANYSQAAEAAADAFAVDSLIAAGADPGALGDFFERLEDEHGGEASVLDHFAAHPALRDRIEAARAAAPPPDAEPLLTEPQWVALQAICD